MHQAPPWRPVQYLGSKLRALPEITEAIGELDSQGTIWEPFTGSTVVAQALAANGHRVLAGDALRASAVFAEALLGVRRQMGSTITRLAARLANSATAGARAEFTDWLAAEHTALAERDGQRLLRLGERLPQRWRTSEQPASALFERVESAARHSAPAFDGLLSATYAGTYFGINQAIELEELRAGIELVPDPWQRAGLLTALCHAASAAVFSPGKHFAQPHRIRDGKSLRFHTRRVLSDRSVDVRAAFLRAAACVDERARAGSERHGAEHTRAESLTAEGLRALGIGVVYADPPYTAQQYSRFYHLLETIVSGVPPRLQTAGGQVTRGLYPSGRYRSPYCSRRRAPDELSELARTAAESGAHLVLSYSTSSGATSGNARSVSLTELVSRVGAVYGPERVVVRPVELRYRQFNARAAEIAGRNDPEYLIIGRAGAGQVSR